MRIDYLGIFLLAIGLGSLEVVLDKGQEDDWFGSPFIIVFAVVSLVALVAAVSWELNQKDPIVDLTLLANRNLALSCVLFFIFGFVLYCTTVLIPQLLQSLSTYVTNTFVHAGYTAVEAANRALGELYAVLNQQASLLSYLDCFLGLIVPATLGLLLTLTIKKFGTGGKSAPAH